MNRYLVPLAAFALMVVFLAVGLTLNPREIPSPFIDKPAPGFELPELDESEAPVSLASFEGEVWLFNVFASWCAACRQEHPLLMQMADADIVTLVGLNYKDKRGDAQQWLSHHGDPYDHIAFDYEGNVGSDYGVYGVPETFVIDSNGKIRMKHIGPLTPEVVTTSIVPLIRQLKGG